jgi:hypothetical protein
MSNPQIAFASASWCDGVRPLDSTPVPGGAARQAVGRAALEREALGAGAWSM